MKAVLSTIIFLRVAICTTEDLTLPQRGNGQRDPRSLLMAKGGHVSELGKGSDRIAQVVVIVQTEIMNYSRENVPFFSLSL